MSRFLLVIALMIGSVSLVRAEPPLPTKAPLVRVADLKVGESEEVELSNQKKVSVKLLDLQETRDDIRSAVRVAKVKVEVDGQPITLTSGNYHLPQTVAGVKIDCPITRGYLENSNTDAWGLVKDARLRLWPVDSPLLRPGTFVYPAKQRWFASATQMANEPVFVDGGERPSVRKIYYHYGLDIGGAEAMVEVVAATDGLVVSSGTTKLEGYEKTPVQPRYDVIYLLDEQGWYYRYSHLHTIDAAIKPGQKVQKGQKLGLLGKEGGSGGWSHLHFDISSRQPSGKWGIQEGYAFLWEAYHNQYQPKIQAVARPHHFTWTGQKVLLDGSRSWAADKIERYEWTFTDGKTASGPAVERTYSRPGSYSEVLKIIDAKGRIDYDFAVVQVLDKEHPDQLTPTIHAAYAPTFGIQPGAEITFKVRTFRTTDGHETWTFGDGSPPVKVQSDGNVKQLAKDGYAVTTHRYAKPGHYLVRVERTAKDGSTAIGHLHVRVGQDEGLTGSGDKSPGARRGDSSSPALAAASAVQADKFAALNEAELKKCLAKLPPGTRHEFTMMPLRDGVMLATDIFLPATGTGPWPVMLLRTPYSRFDPRPVQEMDPEPSVLMCQNQRGRYGSEGTPPKDTFVNEVNDSYDAVEWCAKQKWCNGKVAMWGPSGHGVSPSNAVWSKAPHLVAVNVNITGDDAYLYWCFSNGAKRSMYSWMGQRNQKITDWPRPTTISFDLKARQAFLAQHAANNKVYYLARAGWYDLFSEAALDSFAALAPNGRAFVSMSPGGHGPIGGDLKYPSRNQPREVRAPTIKQLMTGPEPKETRSVLLYYLMGDTRDPSAPGNLWKASSVWPVPNTPTDYYLHANGTLSTSKPKDEDASRSYTYNPRDPAPSLGGNYGLGDKSGPLDQRPLKDRKDLLRFASEPLTEPVGITGKVWVDLHFSTDVPDTMFVVKLVDIHPDGYEALMRESAGLARYHQGLDQGAPIEKGKPYSIKLDLWSTALVFNKGHRIGVYVTSSSKDAYEVHPNSYEPVGSIDQAQEAHQTVLLSAAHASKVILPVIPKENYLKP